MLCPSSNAIDTSMRDSISRFREPMKWISLTFVVVLFVSGSAYGQRPAAVEGVVVDETDAVLRRARVTVIDGAGRTIHTTLTDTEGKFEI
jgi:hypothetical protein